MQTPTDRKKFDKKLIESRKKEMKKTDCTFHAIWLNVSDNRLLFCDDIFNQIKTSLYTSMIFLYFVL